MLARYQSVLQTVHSAVHISALLFCVIKLNFTLSETKRRALLPKPYSKHALTWLSNLWMLSKLKYIWARFEMSSNTDHSLLTISEESTCYSLSFDFDDSCDKCKKFHERKIGISGRKPGKHAIPLCEKPWFIPLTECNYTRLSIKKQLAIDILNI